MISLVLTSSDDIGVPADAQEFNSVEAIKGAVQYGLGAAFISSAAITKELDLGLFKRIDISGVRLNRTLSLVRLLRLPPQLLSHKAAPPFLRNSSHARPDFGHGCLH